MKTVKKFLLAMLCIACCAFCACDCSGVPENSSGGDNSSVSGDIGGDSSSVSDSSVIDDAGGGDYENDGQGDWGV